MVSEDRPQPCGERHVESFSSASLSGLKHHVRRQAKHRQAKHRDASDRMVVCDDGAAGM